MKVEKNKSLRSFNTFGIDVKAAEFISVDSVVTLKKVLEQYRGEDIFILGGGSNMLLTDDINRTVVHINLKGISVVSEDNNEVLPEQLDLKPLLNGVENFGQLVDLLSNLSSEGSNISHGVECIQSHEVSLKLLRY